MNLLLDTHVLLWWYAGTELDEETVNQISTTDNAIWVSAASIWEMRIKQNLGKLEIPPTIMTLLEEDGFEPLPITWADSWTAGNLPNHHRDPFDRMLIAQAQTQRLTLLSRDSAFSSYENLGLQIV